MSPAVTVHLPLADILPVSMGHKLQAEIPGAELVRFADANHSIHAEKPVAFAKLLRAFESSNSISRMEPMPNVRVFANYANSSMNIANR